MKCYIFIGTINEAVERFNNWAKEKPLAKDMIIHTHNTAGHFQDNPIIYTSIIVFFDEKMHPDW